MSPRVVLGAPVYGGAEHLPEALDSLLAQTHRDLALLAVDDASPDGTAALLAAHAARDPRLEWRRNPERIGMAANWRRAFELAVERHPEAEYFAWASDHDVWHRDWLATLVAELDAHPEAVLAYPRREVVDGDGRAVAGPWSWDTRDAADPGARLRGAVRHMRAGDMVYGLFRVSALWRTGGFRPVLWPDRLLLVELSVEGRFRQVSEVLWMRRFAPPQDAREGARRQRRSLYAGAPPPVAHLPWWLGHAAALAAGAGGGRPRPELALRYLLLAGPTELLRGLLRLRNRAARAVLRGTSRSLARARRGGTGG